MTSATPVLHEAHRSTRWPTLAPIAVAGGVATAATAMLPELDAWSVARALVVLSYTSVGIYTAWLRPASRFGAYLTATGLLYAVASWTVSADPLAHTVGRVMLAAFVVWLAYVFLCFPGDTLASRAERRLVSALAASTGVLWLLALVFVQELPVGGPLTDCASSCPDNALQLVSAPDTVSRAVAAAASSVTAVGLVGVVAVLVRKARTPSPLRRRLLVPSLASLVLLTVDYAAYTVLRQAGVTGTGVLRVIGVVAALAIPATLLLGQIRGRLFAAVSLGQLVERAAGTRVTPERIQAVLRTVLGDSRLILALPARGGAGYVDAGGERIELPVGESDVHVTYVVREGRPVAALIHDAVLDGATDITHGLATASLLMLEHTELIEELRASRSRIVAAAQCERLRLERNLHDSAQQRMLGVRIKLQAARERTDDPVAARELDEASAEVAAALDELRDLAHGLYPTVLRERGLADALRSFARTAAVPVTVVAPAVERHAENVEEAVYFCVLEAIQNATKHGGAGVRVTVELERREDVLAFTVTDDGPGFAPGEHNEGMGLVGMRDRLGAVDGEVEITSREGAGTTVRGIAPAF